MKSRMINQIIAVAAIFLGASIAPAWTLVASASPQDPMEPTTEKVDADGTVTRTEPQYSGGKKIGEIKTTTSRDKKGNVTETTEVKNGKGETTKSTTKVTDPNGRWKETTKEGPPNGKGKPISTAEGQNDAKGRKMFEERTGYENGKPTGKTRTEYYPSRDDDHPSKVEEFAPNGTRKKTTEYDYEGNKTSETEYWDNSNNKKKVTTYKDGKPVDETYYDKGGTRIEKTRVYDEDGGYTETPYKNGKPGKPVKYDKNGKPVSDDDKRRMHVPTGASLSGAVVMMPDRVAPGPMTFSVASLNGEVIAGQEVTLSGGAAGSTTVTTDENGQATLDVPSEWKTITARVAGSVATALVVDMMTSDGGRPVIDNLPSRTTPGGIVNVHGRNFSAVPSDNVVTIGGQNARVVAASSNTLTVLAPRTSTGNVPVEVTTNGQHSARSTLEMIELSWDAGPSTLVSGQTITRMLRVTGTTKQVPILIEDPPSDSATATPRGRLLSSGGANNVVPVKIHASHAGGYGLNATLADSEGPAEVDRRNAEVSRADAAGWRESAKGDTNERSRQNKLRAAANADKAADDWERAAKAREAGDSKKAELLEKAAALRDKAANEFGSSNDAEAGEKAAKEAGSLEGQAN
ncbi:MAG TPA: IPT/TIG domain-containing protein [Blastocatellia bacterium]|nr:IPT/TIG domain-containing protein [Blastocatellia bacterium]